MTAKTPAKRTLANFKIRPIIYRHAQNGNLVSGEVIAHTIGMEYADLISAAQGIKDVGAVFKKCNLSGDEIKELCAHYTAGLVSYYPRLIFGEEEERKRAQFIKDLTYVRNLVAEQSGSVWSPTLLAQENQKREQKAARKARMHRFVGMWADIEQDSVELQKELREDWS